MYFGLKVYAHVTSILPADWLKIVHHTLISAKCMFLRVLRRQSFRGNDYISRAQRGKFELPRKLLPKYPKRNMFLAYKSINEGDEHLSDQEDDDN